MAIILVAIHHLPRPVVPRVDASAVPFPVFPKTVPYIAIFSYIRAEADQISVFCFTYVFIPISHIEYLELAVGIIADHRVSVGRVVIGELSEINNVAGFVVASAFA